VGFIDIFLASFVLIGIAELGDKTQVALFSLSAKKHARLPILIGAIAGFSIIDGIAVIFGKAVAEVVPDAAIAILSAAFFIVFGIYFIYGGNEGERKILAKGASALLAAFSLIVLMELGDKSQILTMTLSARYDSIVAVFCGSIAALSVLSALAVALGRALSEKVENVRMQKISGALFILLGILEFTRYFV